MKNSEIERREFIRRVAAGLSVVPFAAACRAQTRKTEPDILERLKARALQRDGEWNGAKDAPSNVSAAADLTGSGEAGETMIIAGTVYKPDGTTPAPNVLIYLYHTDRNGRYGQAGEHRHGRYRGWLLTGPDGHYEFRTIKPAPYPENRFAAHIHMTVTAENLDEDWIDSILFEGDPLISAQERKMAGRKGGFQPIVKLDRGTDGIWRAQRDIRLWNS